jgi:hypothetical protein
MTDREPCHDRRVRSHPLLESFPLAVIGLAMCVLAFAVLMARFAADAEHALRAQAASPLAARAVLAPVRAGAPRATPVRPAGARADE